MCAQELLTLKGMISKQLAGGTCTNPIIC